MLDSLGFHYGWVLYLTTLIISYILGLRLLPPLLFRVEIRTLFQQGRAALFLGWTWLKIGVVFIFVFSVPKRDLAGCVFASSAGFLLGVTHGSANYYGPFNRQSQTVSVV